MRRSEYLFLLNFIFPLIGLLKYSFERSHLLFDSTMPFFVSPPVDASGIDLLYLESSMTMGSKVPYSSLSLSVHSILLF